MSNSCNNMNEVMINFNKMNDGRAFTDYRSCHETNMDLYHNSKKMCPSTENSYDSRICVQRNTGSIINNVNLELNGSYNLPRCNSNNKAN